MRAGARFALCWIHLAVTVLLPMEAGDSRFPGCGSGSLGPRRPIVPGEGQPDPCFARSPGLPRTNSALVQTSGRTNHRVRVWARSSGSRYGSRSTACSGRRPADAPRGSGRLPGPIAPAPRGGPRRRDDQGETPCRRRNQRTEESNEISPWKSTSGSDVTGAMVLERFQVKGHRSRNPASVPPINRNPHCARFCSS